MRVLVLCVYFALWILRSLHLGLILTNLWVELNPLAQSLTHSTQFISLCVGPPQQLGDTVGIRKSHSRWRENVVIHVVGWEDLVRGTWLHYSRHNAEVQSGRTMSDFQAIEVDFNRILKSKDVNGATKTLAIRGGLEDRSLRYVLIQGYRKNIRLSPLAGICIEKARERERRAVSIMTWRLIKSA